MSTDLYDGMELTTVQGQNITITIDGDVFVNDAQVIIPDVLACNGVIHVIDAVLLPPEETCELDVTLDKTVWDPVEEAWTDISMYEFELGERLKFNLTLHNDGCCELSQICFKDILPYELSYPGVNIYYLPEELTDLYIEIINGKTIWYNFTGYLPAGESMSVVFEAEVASIGLDYCVNEAAAYGDPGTGGMEVLGSDLIGIYLMVDDCVCEQPGLEGTKTVWEDTMGWYHSTDAEIGDTVLFNITMHIPEWACPMYSGYLIDYLPDGLKFVNGSANNTIIYEGEVVHHSEGFINDPDYTTPGIDCTILQWGESYYDDSYGIVLPSGSTVYIEFKALVEDCGTFVNKASGTYYYDSSNNISAEDTAEIYCIEE
jgi:fimbrial isopeptide formation D2 family protein